MGAAATSFEQAWSQQQESATDGPEKKKASSNRTTARTSSRSGKGQGQRRAVSVSMDVDGFLEGTTPIDGGGRTGRHKAKPGEVRGNSSSRSGNPNTLNVINVNTLDPM